jgi:hypothetical protein
MYVKFKNGKGAGVKRGHNREMFICEKSLKIKISFSRTTEPEN